MDVECVEFKQIVSGEFVMKCWKWEDGPVVF